MSDEARDPKLSAAEDRWLDRMLNEAASVEPSAAVRRAVAEIPLRHPRAHGSDAHVRLPGAWPAFGFRFALPTALVSLALGAWLGYEANVLPDVVLRDDAQAPSGDEEWDELAQLAFADQLDEELAP